MEQMITSKDITALEAEQSMARTRYKAAAHLEVLSEQLFFRATSDEATSKFMMESAEFFRQLSGLAAKQQAVVAAAAAPSFVLQLSTGKVLSVGASKDQITDIIDGEYTVSPDPSDDAESDLSLLGSIPDFLATDLGRALSLCDDLSSPPIDYT